MRAKETGQTQTEIKDIGYTRKLIMKLNNKHLKEIIAADAANRLQSKPSLEISGNNAINELNKIALFGEINNSPINRVLDLESHAYGFDIEQIILAEREKLVKIYKAATQTIEMDYPKAPGHLNKRIKETRIAAKKLIADNCQLVQTVINAHIDKKSHYV